MKIPLVVFCITCKGRTQHLELTLPQNLADNEGTNSKFVLLDYNSKDHLDAYIKLNYKPLIESGKLVVYRYAGVGSFRMAHAKNMVHRLGILEGADILVNLDADNFTGQGFADYIIEKFQSHGEDILLWARWNQPGAAASLHIPKGCSGRIVVSKQSFLKVGGYDEVKYDTWGPDDKDFHYRLLRLGCTSHEIDRQYLNAILHTDRMRFREYPHASPAINLYQFTSLLDTLDDTIANYGKFGQGVVFRNFDSHPIVLGEVPTRIFGIGMHKTATTSLHAALRLLGFDSAHWESVRWARKIWNEVNEHGKSPTLEKHYALSDLPITLLYEKLDVAYPGSKFILTVRNELNWLKSVKTHWSRSNDFRDTWMKEGSFPKQIHESLYGQIEFDAEIFLARYRRHNAEVKEYFKNRPEDLLIMDIDDGKAGWLELCGFLKQPIPATAYPQEFVSKGIVKS